ncbi:hypothetical protein F4801DRAFT_452293 [Xylaria longipes]|nr:hypothetical protein F4801DRAFT_452293 [Xylaria longipes]RYC56261.1 hypothetical protein CHU98_g9946 [Xylaria longipes]
MPSSIANTLISSSARGALRNGLATTTRASQPLRRTYATQRPTLPEGNGNKPYIYAALVGVPVLVYFIIPPRSNKPRQQPAAARAPNLDPAAHKRNRDENEADRVKYAHPEHENPEEFKPAFGQLHKPKRVDSPPDGRHHQALTDRARQQE